MMPKNRLVGAAVAVVAVLLMLGLAGTCHSNGPGVNEELAEATRVAVDGGVSPGRT